VDKGLKLLFALNWNYNIWGNKPVTDADYNQAIAEGYMFEPAPVLSHDETLCRLQSVLSETSPHDVANAFLYSLSTRRLKYRSVLGSYYYALSIPEHSHDGAGACYFCNWSPVENRYVPGKECSGYDVFNFERYKWGGVRHTHPEYALFDLEQFKLLPKATPSKEDFARQKAVLLAMNELPPSKKAGAYRDLISKMKLLRSNKNEVAKLLNILGICGVLSSAEAPCYCEQFADVWHRSPREHTNDYAYPVNRWHVSDGVNEERFSMVFGFEYIELLKLY